jgi:hypothetical protein
VWQTRACTSDRVALASFFTMGTHSVTHSGRMAGTPWDIELLLEVNPTKLALNEPYKLL